VPLPFANLAFEVGGVVEEEQDYQIKRRALGQFNTYWSDGNYNEGEILYKTPDSAVIMMAEEHISLNSGAYHNSKSINSCSTNANIYIVAKKRY